MERYGWGFGYCTEELSLLAAIWCYYCIQYRAAQMEAKEIGGDGDDGRDDRHDDDERGEASEVDRKPQRPRPSGDAREDSQAPSREEDLEEFYRNAVLAPRRDAVRNER